MDLKMFKIIYIWCTQIYLCSRGMRTCGVCKYDMRCIWRSWDQLGYWSLSPGLFETRYLCCFISACARLAFSVCPPSHRKSTKITDIYYHTAFGDFNSELHFCTLSTLPNETPQPRYLSLTGCQEHPGLYLLITTIFS